MQFHIGNMSCSGCVRSITLAIQSVDPVAEVAADLDRRNIDVRSTHPREHLASALADVGYSPDQPIEGQ